MSHLLQAESTDITRLADRAREVCLVFDELLPPGASPDRARVGFEVDPTDGSAKLHVDRSVSYTGDQQEIADWISTGTKRFDDTDSLVAWLRGPVAEAFGDTASSRRDTGDVPEPIDLVDSAAILEAIQEEVLGQQGALEPLAEAVALHLGRTDPRRPLSIYALGPTGVGKTLTAQTLAQVLSDLTGEEWPFLRLDMNEFQERHTVSRLFGAPPGYIGHDETTPLVDLFRRNQRSIVLIDEIDKAHQDTFTALMNLLDAGRLTPAGRSNTTIDARHSIFVLTSNLAVAELLPQVRQIGDPDERDRAVRRHLRGMGVRPELVGRLHETILFQALEDEHRHSLIRKAIERSAATFGIEIADVDNEVLTQLANERSDDADGVRGIEHLIDRRVGRAFLEARREAVEVGKIEPGPPVRCVDASAETPPNG